MAPPSTSEILAAYDDGEPDVARVASQMGIRTQSVLVALRDRDIVAFSDVHGPAATAAEFGTTTRSISRSRKRMGASKAPARPYGAEELRRARRLAAEGMPVSFIAIELGREEGHLRERLTKEGWLPEGATRAWRSAWSGIRHRPELLELHYELYPKRRSPSGSQS